MPKYSSGYGLVPNANTTTYLYRGPNIERPGQAVLRHHTFTGTLTYNASAALNDVLYIAGGFVAGERIKRIINVRSGDPDAANDFTFNLGFRLGLATAFATTSTAMQAAVAFEVTEAAALAIASVAAEGDDLILTPTAGAAEVSATHTFLIESYLPGSN